MREGLAASDKDHKPLRYVAANGNRLALKSDSKAERETWRADRFVTGDAFLKLLGNVHATPYIVGRAVNPAKRSRVESV
jgi:hypothetical protein